MDSQAKKSDPPYLFVGVAVIFALSVWAASFSRTCQSDGCIGVVFPAGGAILALAAQLFVLVPIYATVKWRAKEPFLRRVAIWLGVSVAAVLIPGLFIKL
jgi:hypothetical protein